MHPNVGQDTGGTRTIMVPVIGYDIRLILPKRTHGLQKYALQEKRTQKRRVKALKQLQTDDLARKPMVNLNQCAPKSWPRRNRYTTAEL